MLSQNTKMKAMGIIHCNTNFLNTNNFKRILAKNETIQDLLLFFIETLEKNMNKEDYSNKLKIKLLLVVAGLSIDTKAYLSKVKDIIKCYCETVSDIPTDLYNSLSKCLDKIDKINALVESREPNEAESISSIEKKIATLEKDIARKDEEIAEFKAKVKDLTNTNKDKNKEIKNIKSLLETLKRDSENLREVYKKLLLDYQELIASNEALAKENSSLSKRLTSLRNRFHELNNKMKAFTSTIELLKREYERKIADLEGKIATLSDDLNAQKMANTELLVRLSVYDNSKDEEDKKIEELILEFLFNSNRGCTLEEIKEKLARVGYNLSKEEIKVYVRNLQKIVCITNKTLDLNNPKYAITPADATTGKTFFIEVPKTGYIDIMFMSDAHIKVLNDRFLNNYNEILEYCDKNGIQMILDLGDLFDFTYGHNQSDSIYDLYKLALDSMRECIAKIPKSTITHALLGGNHESNMLCLGRDFTKKFIDNRDDFIFLGYDYAKILFKMAEMRASILLAHPNLKHKATANSVYGQQFSHQDFAFIGHYHSEQYHFDNKSCNVGAFSFDESDVDKALHTRIYLGDSGVEQIEFKPLELGLKLVPKETKIYTR